MAKNKTEITAASVTDFIDSVVDLKKRQDCYQIIDLFKAQTGLKPEMWGKSIVGFGSYHYVYASGHSGDAPLAGFSPRAAAIVFYLASDPVIREELTAKLGKHKSSKGCIYIKKLEDINTDVMKTMVQHSVDTLQKLYPPTKCLISQAMNNRTVLIIGLVWPEPTSSAAGTRMIQLIKLFLSEGNTVLFACAASKSAFSFNLPEIGVTELEIRLNDSSFNMLVTEIAPSIVLFDRFMIEEQYGWRVQEACPNAVRILDTEDLHFLRRDRQQSLKAMGNPDSFSDVAKREISSILRCDISLIISEYEMQLLQHQYQINSSILHYLPFLENSISPETETLWKTYEERKGFVFIGNFLHEPNWHTVQVLKTEIWPELKKKVPAAGMHIYGAYASQKVTQLHNPKERFYIHGRATDARNTIAQHRVLLAPIQFGAGVKGKFIDAMQTGTPSVTTPVGVEAMSGQLAWSGVVESEVESFIASAANLYQDKTSWLQAQENGVNIINERYNIDLFTQPFVAVLDKLISRLSDHRDKNFIGQILQMNMLKSSKYMSLWIEEKNKNKTI